MNPYVYPPKFLAISVNYHYSCWTGKLWVISSLTEKTNSEKWDQDAACTPCILDQTNTCVTSLDGFSAVHQFQPYEIRPGLPFRHLHSEIIKRKATMFSEARNIRVIFTEKPGRHFANKFVLICHENPGIWSLGSRASADHFVFVAHCQAVRNIVPENQWQKVVVHHYVWAEKNQECTTGGPILRPRWSSMCATQRLNTAQPI